MTMIDTRLGGATALGGSDGTGTEFTLGQVPLNPNELWNASPNGQPVQNAAPVQTISAPGGLPGAVVLDLGDLATTLAARAALMILARDLGLKNVEGKVPQNVSDNLAVMVPTSGSVAKSFAVQLARGFRKSQHELDQRVLAAFLDKAPQIKDLYRETLRVSGGLDAANEAGNVAFSTVGLIRGSTTKPVTSGGGQNRLPGGPAKPVNLSQTGAPAIDLVPGPNGSLVPQFGTAEASQGGATGGALATRPNSGGGQTLANQTTGNQPKPPGPPLLPPGGGTGQKPVGPLPSWGGGPAGSSGTTPIPAGRPSNTTPAQLTLETPQGKPFRVTVVKDKITNTFSVEVPQFRDGTGDITISSVRMKDGSNPPTFTAANQRVAEMLKAGELAYPRAPAGGRTGGSGTSTGTPSGTGFNPNAPFGTASSGATTGMPGTFGGSSFGTNPLPIGVTPSFNPPAAGATATTTFKLGPPVDPMTLFGQSGTAAGPTNSPIPVDGLSFGDKADPAQFSAALPVLNGKKPAEFASQSDAASAAVAFNRQSPVTVAVPLRLAFTDAQGRTMERSVVYEGAPPAKVGELIDTLEKTKSFQVLNRNSALAEAGLSPQGLAARETAGRPAQATDAEPLAAPQAPSANVAKTALALADTLDRLGIDRADLARAREQGRALTTDQARDLHAAATAYVDAHNADPLALRSGPTPDFLAAKAALEGYAEAKGVQGQADLGGVLQSLGGTEAAYKLGGDFLNASISNTSSLGEQRPPDARVVAYAARLNEKGYASIAPTSSEALEAVLHTLGEEIERSIPTLPEVSTIREAYINVLDHLTTRHLIELNGQEFNSVFAERFGRDGERLASTLQASSQAEQNAVMIWLRQNGGFPAEMPKNYRENVLTTFRNDPASRSELSADLIHVTLNIMRDDPSRSTWNDLDQMQRMASVERWLASLNLKFGTNVVAQLSDSNLSSTRFDTIKLSKNHLSHYAMALNAVLHEFNHTLQWKISDARPSWISPPHERARSAAIDLNGRDYIHPSNDYEAYRNQFVEYESFMAGNVAAAVIPVDAQLDRFFPTGIPTTTPDIRHWLPDLLASNLFKDAARNPINSEWLTAELGDQLSMRGIHYEMLPFPDGLPVLKVPLSSDEDSEAFYIDLSLIVEDARGKFPFVGFSDAYHDLTGVTLP